MNTQYFTFILLIATGILFGLNNRYLTMDDPYYLMIEYEMIKSENNHLFVLNQPFTSNDIYNLFDENNSVFKQYFFSKYPYFKKQNLDSTNFSLRVEPGLIYENQTFGISKYLGVNGEIVINNILLVNNFRLDESLRNVPDFHGDTTSWIMGYFGESYASIKFANKSEIFMGRIPRNWGIPNEYSLLFSDYTYPFDHYGFTTYNDNLKYSFYTTRLNDVDAMDIKGQYIPLGETANSKRYWAAQRLDVRFTDNFQMSFSEATIYGGPNQGFVASYLNPVNFFYAAQRNQKNSDIQMSGLWQINLFYKYKRGFSIYLDLFADDIIVNNIPGQDDRSIHPDRLAVQCKLSMADIFYKQMLFSIGYVRIWNETYLSYRTWENYSYFNRSIGYPTMSYEGIKFKLTNFKRIPLVTSFSAEIFQHGDRIITQSLTDEINEFPVIPVVYGIKTNISISLLDWGKINSQLIIKHQTESESFASIIEAKSNIIFKCIMTYKFERTL